MAERIDGICSDGAPYIDPVKKSPLVSKCKFTFDDRYDLNVFGIAKDTSADEIAAMFGGPGIDRERGDFIEYVWKGVQYGNIKFDVTLETLNGRNTRMWIEFPYDHENFTPTVTKEELLKTPELDLDYMVTGAMEERLYKGKYGDIHENLPDKGMAFWGVKEEFACEYAVIPGKEKWGKDIEIGVSIAFPTDDGLYPFAVKLPDEMTTLVDHFCNGHNGLQVVVLGKNVKVLEEGSFAHCQYLYDVTLNDGLEKISDRCFSFCPNLKSITIPASVKEIGNNAFAFHHYSLTIYGKAGPVAEEYANANGISFEPID